MKKLHITQDDNGFWMLSVEDEDGTLTLLAHQFDSPDHLLEDAREMVEQGRFAKAPLLLSAPVPPSPKLVAADGVVQYTRPAPRKVGE